MTRDGMASNDSTDAGSQMEPDLAEGLPTQLRGRDVAVSAIGNVASLLSVVVGAPILAQSLGAEQRGIVAGAIAPLILLLGVATLGIPEAATYYIANRSTAPRRVIIRGVMLIALFGTVACVIVILVALPLAGGNDQLAQLIQLSSLALPLALITLVFRAAAAGLHAWTLIAIERAIFGLVRLGGFITLLVLGHLNALSATLVMAASTFVGALAYTRLLRRRVASTDPDNSNSESLLRFGTRFWIGSIAGVLLARLDQVLMVPLSTATELGLYAVAVSIAEIPLVVSLAVRDVTFSVEAESSSYGRVTAAARITTAVVLALAVGIIAVSYPVVPVLFGPEFVGSIPALAILLMGTALGTCGSICGIALAARGRPGLRSVALAFAAVFNAALLIALLPEFGAVGASVATMAGNLLFTIVNVALCARILGTPASSFLGLRRSDLRIISSVAKSLRSKLARFKKAAA